MYLLDTNIISEMRKVKQDKADKNALAWLESVKGNLLYTSAVVIMELERGVLRMERKDPAQGRSLRLWLEETIREIFTDRTSCPSMNIPPPFVPACTFSTQPRKTTHG